jgi:hypothetical protein
MNANAGGRIRARSRADRRLRALTIGTAVLGAAATGAFGYAAAITYTGTTSAALANDQQAVDDPGAIGDPNAGVTAPNGAVTTPNGGVSNPNPGVTNPSNGSNGQVTTPTVRRTRNRSGHVSTGGS